MNTTTSLSNLLSIYYDAKFLARAELMIRYDWGVDRKTIPANAGKTVKFNRFTPLAVATTALTEGTTPTAVDMSTTIVSATVLEYGNYTKTSTMFKLTSLDKNLEETVEVMGQNAGETIDTLIANEMAAGGTVQLAGSSAALTDIAATDTLSGAELKKAVRTLKKNKAMTFSDGMFRGIVPVSAVYDLRSDSEWTAANTYVNVDLYKNGKIGSLHGIKFVETNNEISESSTVTVYSTFIYGQHAIAMVELAGQSGRRIIVKNPGPSDTSNPLDMYSTVGWNVRFIPKVLNILWLIEIKSGVTA